MSSSFRVISSDTHCINFFLFKVKLQFLIQIENTQKKVLTDKIILIKIIPIHNFVLFRINELIMLIYSIKLLDHIFL